MSDALTKGPTEQLGEVLVHNDGWINDLMNLGGSRDQTAYTRFSPRGRGLDDGTLEAMYSEDHLAARIVELIVRHALRPAWDLRIPGSPEEAARVRAAYQVIEEELDVAGALAEGATLGRLFGGAVTWLGVDEGHGDAGNAALLGRPLDLESVRAVTGLHTFDRREVQVHSIYGDPTHSKFRRPHSFRITPMLVGPLEADRWQHINLAGGFVVHESRLIVWPGALTTHSRRVQRQHWDDSVLERAWDALKQTGEDYGAKSQLLARVSQFVFKVKNLGALVSGDERKFNRRMSLLDHKRSRGRALVIDTEEGVENIAQPVAGIDTLIDKSVERVATAGGVPPTVLVGHATEAEQEAWNLEVEQWRERVLRPRHERVATLILRARLGPTQGSEPATWSIEYRPLRASTPKEQAEIRLLQAQTDAIEIDKGILPPEAVQLHRHTATGPGVTSGDVLLESGEVSAAIERRRELAKKPPKDNAELGTAAARAGGGQLAIIEAVAQGRVPWASGKAVLMQTFGLAEADAIAQLPPEGWRAAPTPGTPGPAPAPALGEGAGAPQGLPGFDDGGDPASKRLPTEAP